MLLGIFGGKPSIILDVTILRQMVHKTNIWGGQDFETEIMSGKNDLWGQSDLILSQKLEVSCIVKSDRLVVGINFDSPETFEK